MTTQADIHADSKAGDQTGDHVEVCACGDACTCGCATSGVCSCNGR